MIRGSVTCEPEGAPMNLLMSSAPLGAPVRRKKARVLFTVSATSLGPTATSASGGATSWSAPNAAMAADCASPGELWSREGGLVAATPADVVVDVDNCLTAGRCFV